MQLQEKEAKKDLSIQKIYLERTYLLFIPDLEPYPKTGTTEPTIRWLFAFAGDLIGYEMES